jgi:hypothetical protein
MIFPRPISSWKGVVLWLVLISMGWLIACDTPEGGSSIPWNRPQSWEHTSPMGGFGPGMGGS